MISYFKTVFFLFAPSVQSDDLCKMSVCWPKWKPDFRLVVTKETVLECVQEATSSLLKVPTNRLQHLLALGLRRHTNPGQGMIVSFFLTSGRSNL